MPSSVCALASAVSAVSCSIAAADVAVSPERIWSRTVDASGIACSSDDFASIACA